MSIRDRFKRRKLWFFSGLIVGMAAIVLGYLMGRGAGLPVLELVIPGIVQVILVSIWANFLAFHCPECGENIATLFLQNSSWFGSRVKYCPFCGSEFDRHDNQEMEQDTISSERFEG